MGRILRLVSLMQSPRVMGRLLMQRGERSDAITKGYGSDSHAKGNHSNAIVTGELSAASVDGSDSFSIDLGFRSKAKACAGSWLILAERNEQVL